MEICNDIVMFLRQKTGCEFAFLVLFFFYGVILMKSSAFIKRLSPVLRITFVLIFLGLQAGLRLNGILDSAQAAPVRDPEPAPVKEAGMPRPLLVPTATVGLGMPGSVFLGEDFDFSVTFNNTGDVPGYGPFIDLIFPVTGADGNDGIDFNSAAYLGTTVESDIQIFPNDGGGIGCVQHPWLRDDTGTLVDVCGTTGDKLVSLKLPFGSLVPSQPEINVTINAHLSDLADLTPTPTVRARGGYMYGENPLDDWCCGDTPIAEPDDTNSDNWPVNATLTPEVVTVQKLFTGFVDPAPEITSGNNFVKMYVVEVDVATGQIFSDLRVIDTLHDAAQFISYTVSGATVKTENSIPSTSTPGGVLDLTFDDLTGVDGTDVTVSFEYFVPSEDASGNPTIDPATGILEPTTNQADVTGDWTPKDIRDDETPINIGTPTVGVDDKSIAIQKGVSVVGGGDPAPTQVLEYIIDFQVSDFFAFDQIVIEDIISDGQHFDDSFTPQLEVDGNPYSLILQDFGNTANYDVACNYSGAQGSECDSSDPAGNDGKSTIAFRISDEIITQGEDGRLVGGCVNPVTGTATPDCVSGYNNDLTIAKLVYRTVIQENFTDIYPSGDASVDQGDELDNRAEASARLLALADFTPGAIVTDDAEAGVSIGREELSKTIYAINGEDPAGSIIDGKVNIAPGDEVTYHLEYELPTSDVENLTFGDYFPLPVFDVDEATWSFDAVNATGFSDAPSPGIVKLGPLDTFYAYMTTGLTAPMTGVLSASDNNTVPDQEPVVTTTSASNLLSIYYANYSDTRHQRTKVDLLFTLTVSDEVFADELFLTNMAHVKEGSTNGDDSQADSIIQFVLREPDMLTTKSVVWAGSTDDGGATWDAQPNATISPVLSTVFDDPSNTPRWTGIITDGSALDSDISGVDAGDVVTFAILLTNNGGSGAFDMVIEDTLISDIFNTPDTANYPLNLQIHLGDGDGIDYDGDGHPDTIQFTGLGGGPAGLPDDSDDIFGGGIKIVDPSETIPAGTAVCQAHSVGAGKNIIIITYDLYVKPDVNPDTFTNTAVNTGYAGADDGPNHVPTPEVGESYPDDVTDTADTTVVADFEKTLEGTEVLRDNSGDVGIGEIITYKLTAIVPEGEIPNARLEDQLEGGLAFVDCTSVIAYSDGSVTTDVVTSLASGSDFSGVCTTTEASGVSNNGETILFELGNIDNNNLDNTLVETIEVTYRAVVTNVVGNQGGTLLNNAAEFIMSDGVDDISLGTDNADEVTILEPDIDTDKDVTPTSRV